MPPTDTLALLPLARFADTLQRSSWTAYKGERGGRGWKKDTGEVRYQDKKPGTGGAEIPETVKAVGAKGAYVKPPVAEARRTLMQMAAVKNKLPPLRGKHAGQSQILTNDPKMRAKVLVAANFVRSLMESNPVLAAAWSKLKFVDGGYAHVKRGLRASAGVLKSDRTRPVVILSKIATAKDVVHELGHVIERHQPGALAATMRFRNKQIGLWRRLASLYLGLQGKGGGETFPLSFPGDLAKGTTRFQARYATRLYAKKRWLFFNRTSATEIISIGLERLFEAPAEFARKNPEYTKFILGVLNGSEIKAQLQRDQGLRGKLRKLIKGYAEKKFPPLVDAALPKSLL